MQVDSMAGRLDVNIEGTDVEALNDVFCGDAKRFRDYLLAKIEDQETKAKAAKSNDPESILS
jgi:hypothetical protein